MTDQRTNLNYIFFGIFSVAFTWLIHEFTHWATSELLGYDTIMRLNGTSPVNGSISSELHGAIISISAPLITVIQALIAFYYLKAKSWNKYVYSLLFTAFFMRLLATFMNFFMANDEARVSLYLGLGTFTLPLITTAILFFMVYKIAGQYNLTRKFHISTTVITLIFISALILSDQFFKIRIM
ncbi:hypothetical protein [Roseivirga misakiensis]|uniref:Peptidase M50 domain-containing protein n=1 Tax=Roseivirga misakiensis TaxID=1563681 RepID=A0A1E5T0Q8_9BACT|nr:hypothetical protein [Roseivirga misakiensis]OEK04949.1 hypothetical protein BFP71_16080 [Roseivirga misakiensis]